MTRATTKAHQARARGCLLGGAIGDALPVRSSSDRVGKTSPPTPTAYETFVASGPDWPTGTITDLVLELTQTTRLHSEYGPSTGWERRYPGW